MPFTCSFLDACLTRISCAPNNLSDSDGADLLCILTHCMSVVCGSRLMTVASTGLARALHTTTRLVALDTSPALAASRSRSDSTRLARDMSWRCFVGRGDSRCSELFASAADSSSSSTLARSRVDELRDSASSRAEHARRRVVSTPSARKQVKANFAHAG